jgi:3-oxoacyl-[acyl-carrier protein] reductase
MDLNLTDRVFLVTAASSGLGFTTARHLVDEGARVVLVARRAEVLAQRRADLGEDHAVTLTGDLTDPEVPARACALAVETFGRLDGALISVGGPPGGAALENTEEQWRGAFESVFLAGVRTIHAVVAAATGPDPVIGMVLSSSARIPSPGLTISNGLRPGLAMLVKQYATELGPRGIRLFGLLPGYVGTERMEWLINQGEDPDARRREFAEMIPLGRIGEPAEFGRTAAFLLSPAASYLTGVLVPVDGGMIPMP